MIINEAAIVCVLAMGQLLAGYGGHLAADYDARFDMCMAVADAQPDNAPDVPMTLVVAVAAHESAFTSPTSKAGAIGVLQIMPQYFCPDRHGVVAPHKRQGKRAGCDLLQYGVRAVQWFYDEYDRDWAQALCHWNSGTKCNSSSRRFARSILRQHRLIEAQLNAVLRHSGDHTP